MASIKTNAPIIKAGEVLVIVQKSGEGYTDRSVYSNVDDVLNQCDGDTVDILRIDLENFHVISVADQMAAAWIGKQTQLSPDDAVPLFVRESFEWDAFVDDCNERDTEDRRYGTYEQQHRIGVYNTVARHA